MERKQSSGRKIKRNHSNALPRYILAIAVQTEKTEIDVSRRRFAHHFSSACIVSGRLAGGVITGRKTIYFATVEQFWKYIFSYTRTNYTTWLVGENVLPQLILCGLPHRFSSGQLHIDRPRSKRVRENNDVDDPHTSALAVLESPPTILGCRVGSTQGRLVIVDTQNWLGVDGVDSGAATGFDEDCQPTVPTSQEVVRSKLEQRAIAVHRTFGELIRFVSDNQLGNFKYTAAGQAFAAFRHRFMLHDIYVHDNIPVQKQERKALFGGRSEVFKMGEFTETVYHLDVNALFPSVMKDYSYPCFLKRSEQREECLELLPGIDWSASVADVELQTDRPLYPLRTDTHVIYPVGVFRTSLCGIELYKAHRNGHIRKCGSWSEYRLAPLFERWVDDLWQLRMEYRQKGNSEYEGLTKLLMNSLYGKFAQLTPSWINVSTNWSLLPFTTVPHYDCIANEWIIYRSVGWQCQRLCKREERPGSFYAISAFVTAAARNRMDALRKTAGAANVLYQGIDSLIVTRGGLANLSNAGEVQSDQLGKLRLQYESDYGCIRGIADYTIGSKVCLSSRALHSEVSELGDVLQHRFYVMSHLFKDGPIDHIEERLDEWHASNKYAKGQVHPDGTVSPLVLGATPMSSSVGSCPLAAAAAANCSISG